GEPDSPADVQAIAAGQHDVENDQIEGQTGRLFIPLFTVSGQVDNVALALQTVSQGHPQSFFVLNEQDIFVHFSVVPRTPFSAAAWDPGSPTIGKCKEIGRASCRERV